MPDRRRDDVEFRTRHEVVIMNHLGGHHMIMRAKQEGDFLIFELEGHLDFETTQQFEDTCTQMIEKTTGPKVIFKMEKLKFVGSSGINQFIKVLKDFNSLDEKPRL